MIGTARELADKYRQFFESKGHKWIPSASLIPEDDSSTLFVSAGIQPLVPYFLGNKHPSGGRLVNVQKCVRTVDIDNVGDTFHHTFFEMLGNWSLGDYFKEEAISWSFEFLTEILGVDRGNLYVTCFEGDENAPKDIVSFDIWQKLGILEKRISFLPKADNWWGPPGIIGPCGPDSEMFVDTMPDLAPVEFSQGSGSGRYREIWNDVFIQYFKNAEGRFEKLVQNNIDTGMGVERAVAILTGQPDHYLTIVWRSIIKAVEALSGKCYEDETVKKPMRIIADHIRSAVFIMADGVEPANKEAGYVLRRLVRRAVRQAKLIGLEKSFVDQVAKAVFDNQENYAGIYPELDKNKESILTVLRQEEFRFRNTLDRGLKEIAKLTDKGQLTPKSAFDVYQTYGFPPEMIEEEAVRIGKGLDKNFVKKFNQYKLDHQELSRTAARGRFRGGLAGHSEKMTKYHTTTHLLHAAIKEVLGEGIYQAGSNITEERLRFDFPHQAKVADDNLAKIEKLVNEMIRKNLPATVETMSFKKAKKIASVIPDKVYPEQVTVYTIGGSREVCGGPHVTETGKLGTFEITKEESCGLGKRRIYGILK